MEDRYGSVLRESLKRSMERPAMYRRANEPYRRTNVRDPQTVRPYVLVIFMVGVLTLGFFSFLALDKFESRFRTPVTQR